MKKKTEPVKLKHYQDYLRAQKQELLFAKLDNSLFRTSSVNECDFNHFKLCTNDNLLSTHLAANKEPAQKPIELTTLMKYQFRDHFCGQI